METPEIFRSENTQSLHYPFPKNQNRIIGDMNVALERIKLMRSGKVHITGTIPKINVTPDEEPETMEVNNMSIEETLETQEVSMEELYEEVPTKPLIEDKVEDSTDEQKKQRKKERRLARKAKKAAEGGEPKLPGPKPEKLTPKEEFKHEWSKKNLVTQMKGSLSYDTMRCNKCGLEKKCFGLSRDLPENGCTKE